MFSFQGRSVNRRLPYHCGQTNVCLPCFSHFPFWSGPPWVRHYISNWEANMVHRMCKMGQGFPYVLAWAASSLQIYVHRWVQTDTEIETSNGKLRPTQHTHRTNETQEAANPTPQKPKTTDTRHNIMATAKGWAGGWAKEACSDSRGGV